jgi:hypothetical protein
MSRETGTVKLNGSPVDGEDTGLTKEKGESDMTLAEAKALGKIAEQHGYTVLDYGSYRYEQYYKLKTAYVLILQNKNGEHISCESRANFEMGRFSYRTNFF